MPKISRRQHSSNQKSHIQCKEQSTREEIEEKISSSIGDQNIYVEDNSHMDTDNGIEKNVDNDVECEEINDVNDEADDDKECDAKDIYEETLSPLKKFRKKQY
eukprot:4088113-Ditylum_brightwellii.AAC.1